MSPAIPTQIRATHPIRRLARHRRGHRRCRRAGSAGGLAGRVLLIYRAREPKPETTDGHWRLTETTGAHQTETFYDGLWRPILSRDVDLSRPTQARFTRSAYDAESRIVFSAYPGYLASTASSYTTLSAGVTSTYDVLSRPLTSSATSELGALTTTTQYLTGFRTRVTNPRGFVTETSYQAFDQPSTRCASPPTYVLDGGFVGVIDSGALHLGCFLF